MKLDKSCTEKGSVYWLVINGRRYRLNRVIFAIVMVITTLAIIWPGYALFSSATPLIFGLPLSFAWIVFWTLVSFFAMVALYITDNHQNGAD